jgi:hypothetical protein
LVGYVLLIHARVANYRSTTLFQTVSDKVFSETRIQPVA